MSDELRDAIARLEQATEASREAVDKTREGEFTATDMAAFSAISVAVAQNNVVLATLREIVDRLNLIDMAISYLKAIYEATQEPSKS